MHLLAESAILPLSSGSAFHSPFGGAERRKEANVIFLKSFLKIHMSEEKENNSQWDFYHSRNTKPEAALLKAQHISQHGTGIYVSTSQHQGCHQDPRAENRQQPQPPQQHTDHYRGILLQFPSSLI